MMLIRDGRYSWHYLGGRFTRISNPERS
jgi:hypothetical protein